MRDAFVISLPDKPLNIQTPRQERVLARLRLVGPGPAAFYADSLRILGVADSLECATHLIGHCYREIESALQDVLLPDGLPSEERKLGDKHKDSHVRKVRAILDALCIDQESDIARLWRRIATKEDEESLHRAAHRDALARPRAFDERFRLRCDELEALFDAILDRFEAQFADHLALVDELAKTDSPSVGHVKRLRQSVASNPTTLARFFGQIDLRWLAPLRDGGVFERAPLTGAWPASEYLARIASSGDADLRQVVAAVAYDLADTDNPWVNRDLARIALSADPDAAARLAARLETKLPNGAPGFAEQLGQLAERLANEGRSDAAIGLLRVLLGLTSDGVGNGG